ncbi:MAG: FkbM family methyltransferase [Bdellovibrionaceae bacterium]|nr:FkbM family methyltransferase [Pseudobdellovibrionaceae bacterium]
MEHVFRTVPRHGIFLDIGANIGNHTVFFAAFMAKQVVSFEPHPMLFGILEEVIRRNGLDNVTCLELALSSHSGKGRLVLPQGAQGNYGVFTLSGGEDTPGGVEVSLRSLDEVLASLSEVAGESITAIKIDVERTEEEVLAGAQKTIAEHRPHLFIEIQEADRRERITHELADLGYRVVGCFCATPTYHFAPWSATKHFLFRVKRKLAAIARRKK